MRRWRLYISQPQQVSLCLCLYPDPQYRKQTENPNQPSGVRDLSVVTHSLTMKLGGGLVSRQPVTSTDTIYSVGKWKSACRGPCPLLRYFLCEDVSKDMGSLGGRAQEAGSLRAWGVIRSPISRFFIFTFTLQSWLQLNKLSIARSHSLSAFGTLRAMRRTYFVRC